MDVIRNMCKMLVLLIFITGISGDLVQLANEGYNNMNSVHEHRYKDKAEHLHEKRDCESKSSFHCKFNDRSGICILKCSTVMNYVLEYLIENKHTNLEKLTIVLDSYSWLQYYPNYLNNDLNITKLYNFINLTELRIVPTKNQEVPVEFIFTNDTFCLMRHMTILYINVPLIDTLFPPFPTFMKNLTLLDFGNTRGISYAHIVSLTKSTPTGLQRLSLQRFQSFGTDGYNPVVSPTDFFNEPRDMLSWLDLSYNGFQLIKAGWFKYVPNLEYIDVSHNLLTVATSTPFMFELLMHPTLKYMNYSFQGYDLHYDTASFDFSYKYVKDAQYMYENTSDNHCPQPANGLSSPMMINCINEYSSGNVSNGFNCSSDVFCRFIQNCITPDWVDFSCDVLPCLADIYDYSCAYAVYLPFGSKLEDVLFQSSYLDPSTHVGFVTSEKLCFRENSLKHWTFADNGPWANAEKVGDSFNNAQEVIGLDTVEELDVSNCNMNLFIKQVSFDIGNLRTFNLSLNTVNITRDSSVCEALDTHFLKHLDLSSSYLDMRNISNLVTNCSRLKNVYLAGNNFDSSVYLNLDGTKELSLLDLSYNKITHIGNKFSNEIDRASMQINFTLDITNNPLRCGCTEKEFVRWFHTTRVNLSNREQLTCSGLHGITSLKNVHYISLRNECWNLIPIVTSISVSVLLLLSTALSLTIYKKRNHIRYQLFKWKQRKRRILDNDQNEEPSYEFDAFISYCSEDRFWVHNVLAKELEETYRFKIAIHYRDFALGVPIVEEMQRCLENSREFIIVLTAQSLQSEWCNFELREAYSLAIGRGQRLVVIKLGELPDISTIESGTVRNVLQNHYLEWNINLEFSKNGEKLFWVKLVEHLYGNDDSCTCCSFGSWSTGYRQIDDYASAVQADNSQMRTSSSNSHELG